MSHLIGDVELDESYFGARRIRGFHGKLKRGRGTNKQPVFRIFKRDNIFGKETVYTEIVPDCKKKTLQDIIKGRVDLASTITTDCWRGYDGLVDVLATTNILDTIIVKMNLQSKEVTEQLLQ